MKRQNLYWKRHRNIWISGSIGALCLVLLAVCFLPVFGETLEASSTVQQYYKSLDIKSGTTIVPGDSGVSDGVIKDNTWFRENTSSEVSIKFDIDVFAKQTVQATANISEDGEVIRTSKLNMNSYTVDFPADGNKYSEDAVFYLSDMSTTILNQGYQTRAIELKKNESSAVRLSSIWWDGSYTTTLYRVITDSDKDKYATTQSFMGFEESFRKYLNGKFELSNENAGYFLKSPEESYNSNNLKTELQNYIVNQNYQSYVSRKQISLKNVKRIDMITCSWGKFDFADMSSGYNYYELLTFQTHSYVFPGCTKREVAPEVVANSGRTFSEGLSSDDCLTLNYTPSSESISSSDYTMEYALSDKKLSSSDNFDWHTYTDSIQLKDNVDKTYIYTRISSKDKEKLLSSKVDSYHWSYITSQASPVTTNISDVDKGDVIHLNVAGAQGLILYSEDSDIVWTKKVSLPSTLSGYIEAKTDGGKISYWRDTENRVNYIRVNGIYYECNKIVYLYEIGKPIVVGDKIYDGRISLYVFHLKDSCIVGAPVQLDFNLKFKRIVETPKLTTDSKTSNLKINDSIFLDLDSEDNAQIFYTLNGSDPTVKVTVYDDDNIKLESADSATLPYESKIVVSKGDYFNYGKEITLKAKAFYYETINGTLKQTREASEPLIWTSKIDYPMLTSPSVETESGTVMSSSNGIKLFRDDTFKLTLDCSEFNNKFGSEFGTIDKNSYTIQYKLSLNQMNTQDISSWSTYKEGSSIPLTGGQRYLYIKAVPKENVKASESEIVSYNWTYNDTKPPSVISEDKIENVDKGSKIHLKETDNGTSTAKGIILYTLDGTSPVLKKATTAPSESPQTGPNGIYYISDKDNRISYVKVNGLWFQCGTSGATAGSVYLYTGEIVVDEEIYTKGYLAIWAQCIVSGCVIGSPNRLSYPHELTHTVSTPKIFTSDGKETIKMGESISVACDDANTNIFYTLDGSAPSIMVVDNQLKAGENTFLYDGSVVMSENQLDYGQRVTITAQAVSYELVNGQLVRNKKDSELIQKTYLIENQSTIEAVTSIPTTNSETPTVVMAGSKIHLSCKSENTTIFYTLDGTEPRFNKQTLAVEGSSTYKYNASQAVVVPEATNSTLLTITAVAYDGVASSDITRLIYQYPEAVSSPYVTPAEGAVTENTEVILKTASADAIIYYEIAYDDATPSTPNAETSIVFDATSPIKITKKTTIKAIAVRNNMKSVVSTFVYTVADKLKTPESSIESGSIISNGTMIRLKADEGATIHYTIDGSDPKDSKNKAVLIGDQVLIQGDVGSVVTLKAYASKTNFSDSEIAYYTFSISSYSGGIYADKEDGSTVKNGEVIHLNTDVSDADIYYTTDGSTPTDDSSKGSSVKISGSPNENVVVKAIAVSKGTEKSISFATFTYKIMNRLAAPTASVPDGAVFTKEGLVTLTAESGKIYYTTDGSEPSTASNLYRSGIRIQESLQIKAIAVEDGYEHSEVSSFSYAFASQVETPQASFASGELEMGTEISFYCATEGASLYYRTDGIEPDPSNKNDVSLYTGPITVDKATTFKVIAVKDRMQDSKVITVAYTVREPIIEELIEEEESQVISNNTDRLQSRRSFSDIETGPSYSDVVLKNATYGAVVSADEGILPDDVQLKVEYVQTNNVAQHSIKQMISENYGIVASYDVSLLVNGEATQPNGKVEIGIPIPVQYENSLIQVVHVDEDGTIEVYDTRRSRGVAYAKVDHFSVYALAAPIDYAEKAEDFPWKTVIYFTSVAFIGLGGFLLNRARKMKKEGEE